MSETTPRETNAQRLQRAADILRQGAGDGQRSEFVAQMLEHCKMIADFWSEPYAAPFVPMLESALKLTGIILGDRPARIVTVPGAMAWDDRLIRMPVSAGILHGILRLPDHMKVVDVAWTDRHDVFDFMILVPDAPPGAVVMEPTYHRSSGWPDPIQLQDITWGFLPGVELPAAAETSASAADPDGAGGH